MCFGFEILPTIVLIFGQLCSAKIRSFAMRSPSQAHIHDASRRVRGSLTTRYPTGRLCRCWLDWTGSDMGAPPSKPALGA
jgi:hypothetical protein